MAVKRFTNKKDKQNKKTKKIMKGGGNKPLKPISDNPQKQESPERAARRASIEKYRQQKANTADIVKIMQNPMEKWSNEDHAKYNQMETKGLINKIKINSERRGNQLYKKISNAIGKQPQSTFRAKNVNISSREQRLREQFPKLDQETLSRMAKLQHTQQPERKLSTNNDKRSKREAELRGKFPNSDEKTLRIMVEQAMPSAGKNMNAYEILNPNPNFFKGKSTYSLWKIPTVNMLVNSYNKTINGLREKANQSTSTTKKQKLNEIATKFEKTFNDYLLSLLPPNIRKQYENSEY